MQIADRLAWCLKQGNLTVADLARWFDRPDPTVRGWVKGGAVGGAPQDVDDINTRLRILERMIKTKTVFPVRRMSQRARGAYIETIKKRAAL